MGCLGGAGAAAGAAGAVGFTGVEKKRVDADTRRVHTLVYFFYSSSEMKSVCHRM